MIPARWVVASATSAARPGHVPGTPYTRRPCAHGGPSEPRLGSSSPRASRCPSLRRRFKIPPAVVLGGAGLTPAALCVARSAVAGRATPGYALLNMWAYLAAYEMPHDDPERLEARVHVRLPDRDRPGPRPRACRRRSACNALSTPGKINRLERVLVWCHWMWFFVPHATVAYVWWRAPDRFPSAAARMYARVRHRRRVLLGDPDGAARGTRPRRVASTTARRSTSGG